MAEPKIGRTVYLQNPINQRKQLGITHDEKVVERYVHAPYKNVLDSYHQTIRRNRAKERWRANDR